MENLQEYRRKIADIAKRLKTNMEETACHEFIQEHYQWNLSGLDWGDKRFYIPPLEYISEQIDKFTHQTTYCKDIGKSYKFLIDLINGKRIDLAEIKSLQTKLGITTHFMKSPQTQKDPELKSFLYATTLLDLTRLNLSHWKLSLKAERAKILKQLETLSENSPYDPM